MKIVEEDVLGGMMVTLNVVVRPRLVRNVMPSGRTEGSGEWAGSRGGIDDGEGQIGNDGACLASR
ncbi:MAG: hypothetical protein OEZ02_01595 [Anaerolineae bacterium]|nr:hypothetical protein [Anaerolineae bacterium]